MQRPRVVSRIGADSFRNAGVVLTAVVVAFVVIAAQGSRCGGRKIRQLYEPAAAVSTALNRGVTACALADVSARAATTMDGQKREHDRAALSPAAPSLPAAPPALSARAGSRPDVHGTQPETQRVLRI